MTTAKNSPMGSRERILARVRSALSDVPLQETPQDVEVLRQYDSAHAQGPSIDVLADRLADYKAVVHRVGEDELPGTIAEALRRRKAERVATPSDTPDDWFTGVGAEIVRDAPVDAAPLGVAELDAVDGVVTGCSVAIAETGTIILDTGAHQGRRALTLIPDYHLCVVRAGQVVDSVPEAVDRLTPSLPQTWISGPSATSDIELQRVEGVHGPRTLEVVIVE